MLTKPSIESLLPKVDSRYTLAILVAKRARQIVMGGKVLVACDSPNTVTQACEELAGDRLAFVRGDLPLIHNRDQFAYGVFVGLRPDVIAAREQQQDPDARSIDLVDDLGDDLLEPVVVEATSEAALVELVEEAAELVDIVEESGEAPLDEPGTEPTTEEEPA
jgi:DNA-directed RNA polymerase subunit omega